MVRRYSIWSRNSTTCVARGKPIEYVSVVQPEALSLTYNLALINASEVLSAYVSGHRAMHVLILKNAHQLKKSKNVVKNRHTIRLDPLVGLPSCQEK